MSLRQDTINYSLLFGMSEVTKTLKVDKKFILAYIYHFSDFFSPQAKPQKGLKRLFILNDIRVLAYISMYWEEDPDVEYIRLCLNSGEQHETPFDELIQELTPIFQEFTDTHLDNSRGVVIAGISDYSDKFQLAKNYKKSGDELISIAFANDEIIELDYPAIFCYRHSIELFLKSTIGKEILHHKLNELYSDFEKLILEQFNLLIPKWFRDLVLALHDFDSSGVTFRYGEQIEKDEHFVDLHHLKTLMTFAENSFVKIRQEKDFS